LLTKYPEQLPADLPASVRHFSFVPFSQLLPRAAALVHHGGIGSSAQGLAAGVPQLVMPMAFDQPDNAARLERLGVAASIPPKKFRGPAVARALEHLLEEAHVQQQCRHWAGQCSGEAALAAACDRLELLGASC
jgi:UDP:flavonoid glycosyltransferase YjiC (YdhE family)